MNDERHSLRKAAILIDSLDTQSADALLDQMAPQQADRVRQSVMELDDVSRAEREGIMAEFLGRQRPAPARVDTATENEGIEIDPSLADRLARGDDEPAPKTTEPDSSETPFRFLHEADGTLIAKFLNDENPQTIAVVLAHLPPERAADALARLAADRQTEVIRRIAHLDETPPEVLRDVEAELGSRLSEQLQTMRRRTVGLAAVRQIFDAAATTDRQDLLVHLAAADASLAEQVSDTRPSGDPAFTTSQQAEQSRPEQSRPDPAPRRLAPGRRPAWLAGADASPIQPPRHKFADRIRPAAATNSEAADQHTGRPASERPATAPLGSRGFLPPQPRTASAAQGPPENMAPKTPPPQDNSPSEPVPQPAPVPTQPKIKFDDLAQVSDTALATVFAQVDIDVALLALTGADQQLVQRLTKHLPAKQAKQINKRLARPGPLRLRDIERAQVEVARLAEQLAEKKEITWPATRERLAATA